MDDDDPIKSWDFEGPLPSNSQSGGGSLPVTRVLDQPSLPIVWLLLSALGRS